MLAGLVQKSHVFFWFGIFPFVECKFTLYHNKTGSCKFIIELPRVSESSEAAPTKRKYHFKATDRLEYIQYIIYYIYVKRRLGTKKGSKKNH